MKGAHTYFFTGLAICVVAIISVIYKIEDDRKNRDTSFSIVSGGGTSSAERSQGRDGGMPRSARRQRPAREHLGVLSRLGYVLTADDIGDHTAKGNVKVIVPDGTILRSHSITISSGRDNIFLHSKSDRDHNSFYSGILVEPTSGDQMYYLDGPAVIALDGSSKLFKGKPLYAPGSTFMRPVSQYKKE